MAHTAIAVNFNESLNVKCSVSAQITFNIQVLLNVITNFGNLILGKISATSIGINSGCLYDLSSSGTADTIDVSKADLNSLVVGQVNTRNTCHIVLPPNYCSGLALTLFVLWIFTDNHDFTIALNHFAFVANFLYRRSDFHLNILLYLL